jgi:hypothetical protein
MSLDDFGEKRDWALDLLRTAPIDSEAWDAAQEYLHQLFVSGAEART